MARPLGDIRPPGVYISHIEATSRAMSLADTRVAGFVGLTARGPLDTPIRVSSWDEFVEVYGNVDVGYLANAVEGFFLNGGQTCYVVRVAHRARGDQKPGPEHAYAAEIVAKDAWD